MIEDNVEIILTNMSPKADPTPPNPHTPGLKALSVLTRLQTEKMYHFLKFEKTDVFPPGTLL